MAKSVTKIALVQDLGFFHGYSGLTGFDFDWEVLIRCCWDGHAGDDISRYCLFFVVVCSLAGLEISSGTVV